MPLAPYRPLFRGCLQLKTAEAAEAFKPGQQLDVNAMFQEGTVVDVAGEPAGRFETTNACNMAPVQCATYPWPAWLPAASLLAVYCHQPPAWPLRLYSRRCHCRPLLLCRRAPS